jgi:hypothetical protein
MSKFIKYTPEYALSLCPSKDEIISERLSKHFDWINELFLQSTQYQDNRKKINYNQINSQKWRSINNNIVNSILLMLNSIDSSLYNETEKKIIEMEIKDINNMRKIIEIIHEKSCESFNSQQVLNLYTNLLTRIIDSGKWYYKIGDKITDYICPRIVAVSLAQKNYLEMLDTFLAIIENFNKTKDEVSYFKVKNQKFIGNMLYIAKLYNNHIISIEIINKICTDVITKVKNDIVNCDLVEYLLNLLQMIEDYPNLENVINDLKEIKDILPPRIKFFVMNYIDDTNKSKIKLAAENEAKETSKFVKSNETYSNLIMEYIINESKDDLLNSLKLTVDGEFVQAVLIKYGPNYEDKLFKIVNIVLDNKIITKDYIKEKIELYRENGVVEDIAEECPIVRKFIDKILIL